jgi:hypothetical protein
MPSQSFNLPRAFAILENSEIWLDQNKIRAFASTISSEHLQLPAWRGPAFPASDDESTASLLFVANAVNFSFWGLPKWTVHYKDRSFDGSLGLFAAFTRALEEGIPILEADYLAELSEPQLAKILRGNVQIPMFSERLGILNETGRILANRFEGSPTSILAQAEGDAEKLVSLVTRRFPSFRDISTFRSLRVAFNKRAQLVAAMLYARFRGESFGEFMGFDSFTLFADYKLPQVLRHLGILRYKKGMAEKVDNLVELTTLEGDTIRLATVCAGEYILDHLTKIFPHANAIHLDSLLWLRSQDAVTRMCPYHRTRSIYY